MTLSLEGNHRLTYQIQGEFSWDAQMVIKCNHTFGLILKVVYTGINSFLAVAYATAPVRTAWLSQEVSVWVSVKIGDPPLQV